MDNLYTHPENMFYSSERNVQILIDLLKKNGVRKVVISPGATNICLNGSLQSDPFFELYSSVDERSAAYIAVGLAAESGEAVALSCTGSSASRNYIPGLTEAYYRKLPVLAITSTQRRGRVGQYCPQVIDRSVLANDIAMESVNADVVHDAEDEWECAINVNKALLALKRHGGGPAHINLTTSYSKDFSVKSIHETKAVELISDCLEMPSINEYKRISILVGVHAKWSDRLFNSVEEFCNKYDAVVIANHASNYRGSFGYNPDLINNMQGYIAKTEKADLVIYIGSVSRYNSGMKEKSMWRVNPDGMIRDFEHATTCVFAMDEVTFFEYYNCQKSEVGSVNYAKTWQDEKEEILKNTPELPFSNVWIAQQLSSKLPDNSVAHIAGSNTARCWNFFSIPKSVECYSNDGVMGIDGQVSALVGESLANKDRIHFGFVGDLTFFYDMNSLGNRHIGNNIRLLVVNNGGGAEFKINTHPAYKFGDSADYYIAAKGHYGDMSRDLLKNYASALGFEYLVAENKEEFSSRLSVFLDPNPRKQSIVFEVFTDCESEDKAIYIMNHLISSSLGKGVDITKKIVRGIAGEQGIEAVKTMVNKIKG